jgi:hypothetical protein
LLRRDVLIVWGELISLKAERAYPQSGAHIDLTEASSVA